MTAELGGLSGGYDRRNFDKGPTTYSDEAFVDRIFAASGLQDLSPGADVLDVMSGPGKLGLALQERSPQHNFFYLDLSLMQLKKIPDPTPQGLRSHRIRANALIHPIASESIDVVIMRYALKDVPDAGQGNLVQSFFDTLRPGGTFVLVDMVAPNVGGAKQWLNNHHALKQRLSGRDEEREGRCNILTKGEWTVLLRRAGFVPKMHEGHISFVTTTDWVAGSQITQEQLTFMNKNLLTASEEIKHAFKIREEEEGLVKIDYPVVILTGRKPLAT